MAREDSIELISLDGELLSAILTRVEAPVGLAVLVHGITSEKNESGFYTELAAQLAKRGISSIRADWRCHGANHLPSRELSLSGMVNDIAQAANAVRRANPDVAPITSLIAASFGGGASALWAARDAASLKSVVLLAPVLDYAADLFRSGQWKNGELTEAGQRELRETEQIETGTLPVGRAMVNDIPNQQIPAAIAAIRCPKTIFHGTEDSDVSIELSRPFQRDPFNCALIEVPGVDHGFVKPGTDFDHPETRENHRRLLPNIAERVASDLRDARSHK